MSRHARAARSACFDIALTMFIGLAFAAPGTAQGEKRYDTGASDAIIKIGNTAPYSGPLSLLLRIRFEEASSVGRSPGSGHMRGGRDARGHRSLCKAQQDNSMN